MNKIKNELFKNNSLKTPYVLLICMIIACLLEVLVFNYQSYLHIFNKEPIYDANQFIVNLGSAIENKGNGTYYLATNDITTKAQTYQAYYEELQSNEIEITNINKHIQTVCIEIESEFMYSATVTPYVTDESNKLYLQNPSVEISKFVGRSAYIQLHTNGETERIKFAIDNTDITGNSYHIKSITFNKSVPFEFNGGRFIVVFLFLAFLFAIRPKSPLHSIRYDSTNKQHNMAVFIFLVAVTGILIIMSFTTTIYGSSLINDYCDAILSGNLSLGKAPYTLSQMENPFDANYREYLLHMNSEEITNDSAYYNGNIYVYFGILPVLLLYVPAKLIFGIDLISNSAIAIISLITVIMSFLFIKQVNRVWFKSKMSVISFMAAIWFLTLGSGVVWSATRNEYYEIFPAAAYCLSLAGLTAWLKSIDDKRKKLKKLYLVIGSICMAATVLCRPTWLFLSLLAIPLFAERMFGGIFKKNKKDIINFIYFIAPYVIIGIITMILNYVRFGSIFSFGDKYQLTLTDMNSSNDIAKLPFGVFFYLLQPPVYSSMFPYITPAITETNYQGYYFHSKLTYGSIFLCYPITLCIFALKPMKEYLKQKDKSLYYFALTAIIIGFTEVLLTTVLGGICQRYACDFLALFIIASLLIFASMYERYKDTQAFKYIVIFMIFAMLTASFMALSQWTGGDVSLMIKLKQPKLYYYLYYTFNFFL